MKNIRFLLSSAFLILILCVGGSQFASAAAQPKVDTGTPSLDTGTPSLDTGTPSLDTGTTGLTNPLKVNSIAELIDAIMGYVVSVGEIFLTFMLIYVGFKFVEARGNEEKVSTARSALLWTVVGGLLLVGAKIISAAIAATVQSIL